MEHVAHSVDASQFIRVRPWQDGCIEVETVNRGGRVEVWLDTDGIAELRTALDAAERESPVEDE